MSQCVIQMRMPTGKNRCQIVDWVSFHWCCPIMNKACPQPQSGERPSWCPIVCQLPEGHGRLIDASSKVMVPMDEDGEPQEMTIDSLLDYVTPFIESIVPKESSGEKELSSK